MPSHDEIVKDLEVIRPYFDGLVTYGAADPAEAILQAAETLHFRGVILGIWSPTDKSELAAAVKIARSHPSLVKAICVGNEGLTFHRYSFAQLRQAFDALRSEALASRWARPNRSRSTATAGSRPFPTYTCPTSTRPSTCPGRPPSRSRWHGSWNAPAPWPK